MRANTAIHLVLATVLIAGSGCATWGQRTVFGEKRELGRRMLGAPQIEQTTSIGGSASIDSATAHGRRTSVTGTDFSATGGSVQRTHCVQQAEVTYEQDYDLVAAPVGREGDVIGGMLLGVAGLTSITVAAIRAQDSIFEPGDPFYEEPADPTAGYLIGGALIAGGVAWISYSFSALPKGPPPPTESKTNTWTETTFVESTGCGLVPADNASETSGDVEERLRKLDQLHQSGLLSDDEYQQKRQEILEQL